MEGVTLGMNYGLNRLRKLGVRPSQIRVTGGGARSKVWRQIMADVFQTEVVTLKVSEGAAYGAALQAMWCWHNQQGKSTSINALTDRFVRLHSRERATPNPKHASFYQELQSMQDTSGKALLRLFDQHRSFTQG